MINQIIKYTKNIFLYLVIFILITISLVAIYQYHINNQIYNKVFKINGIVTNSKHKKLYNLGITNLNNNNHIYSSINVSFLFNDNITFLTINDFFHKEYNKNDNIILYYDQQNNKLFKNNPCNIKYLLIIFALILILLSIYFIFYFNKSSDIIINDEVFNLIDNSLNSDN